MLLPHSSTPMWSPKSTWISPKVSEKNIKGRKRNGIQTKKALKGIREAPRAWDFPLNEWLLNIRFQQSKVDPAVYTILRKCQIHILTVYVGECILVGKQGPFKSNFSSRF
jgi:hypothetical protein